MDTYPLFVVVIVTGGNGVSKQLLYSVVGQKNSAMVCLFHREEATKVLCIAIMYHKLSRVSTAGK